MLKIRLARGGAKKRPHYSIVVADSRSPRDGRFIEKVGAYDPRLPKDSASRVVLNGERIGAWLAKGAQPTERVARFLAGQGLAQWTPGNNPKKGEPHERAKERTKAREERAALRAAQPAEEAEVATLAADDVEASGPSDEASVEAPAVEEVEGAEAAEGPAAEATLANPEDAPAAEAPAEAAAEAPPAPETEDAAEG